MSQPEFFSGWFLAGIVLLIIWSAFWKGLALWKAARRNEKAWFVALFVINTAGFLEILYYFVFSKDGAKAAPTEDTLKQG